MESKELKNAEDYFRYIGHEIDPERIPETRYYQLIIGDLLADENIENPGHDTIILKSKAKSEFRQITIKGLDAHKSIINDPDSVEAFIPRHRSLADYCIGQPIHFKFFSPNSIILAGQNLFVSKFNALLRSYGAFIFLREDAYLKRKGLPKVFLSQRSYIQEVFPAYIKEQMFDGCVVNGKKVRHDLILYPEQEKDPVTKKRSGGRTKTGVLRELSHIFFDKLKALTKQSSTRLYITPVNISFSKTIEVPYIVHPIKSKGLMKTLRYMLEQFFIFSEYPRYAHRHHEAKLDAVVHYGKPELLSSENFTSMTDLLRFTKTLKHKIGMLESIFPIPFLFRIMDRESDIPFSTLEEKAKKLFNYYKSLDIDVENISSPDGSMTPLKELIDRAVIHLNSNPFMFITGLKDNDFLRFKSGRLFSNDPKVQSWYANNLRHLDTPHSS
ncbi:MAG: hypothetical protein JW969_21080 [Spirochaetales bacterium]|nr:hypothetical protein [Spirochaetales bacterium]